MTFDFGALPPEITSAKIYSGPGSASMTAAASAWSGLAAELNSAAVGYDSVVTALASEEWMGPASAAMAAAAQPYVAWTSTTATLAEEAATRARAAAAAYEQVLASVVPPPMIAINRTELAQALQTNLFGQNNGVIAQLEAQYAQFWAQNSAAMYSYAGQAAAATNVNPFTSAPNIANPAAAATQAAGQANTAATVQQTLQSYLTQIQQTLQPAADARRGELVRPATRSFQSVADPNLVPDQRTDHPAVKHRDFLVWLQQLRELLLQHRGSAVLQRGYGQLRCSDGQDGGHPHHRRTGGRGGHPETAGDRRRAWRRRRCRQPGVGRSGRRSPPRTPGSSGFVAWSIDGTATGAPRGAGDQ